MNGVIEALHIYDERTLTHANLLFLLTTSSEIEPLLALEFLHRVVDALEEFLGAPLQAAKIEAGHHVAAQLLTEMCDAGAVATTEPNALRDLVEVEGFMGKLLGGLNLPGKLPPVVGGGTLANPSSSLVTQIASLPASSSPALPWRRANVRHTSNEIYADVVETLAVTLAPSGRPLAAFAHGTVAMTCKVSGIPDIVVTLAGPSGTGRQHGLDRVIERPVFHPCVRLARWKECPGELSFVPPDGRFILAGYEVDLLPTTDGKTGANSLRLPVGIEIRTGLGAAGLDFEVKLFVNRIFPLPTGSGSGSGSGGGTQAGTPAVPLLQDVSVTVPLPAGVRNLSEMRPSKGDATYSAGDRTLEWNIPTKETAAGTTSYFGLRCTVVGASAAGDEQQDDADEAGLGFGLADQAYDDQASAKKSDKRKDGPDNDRDEKRVALNRTLMPRSASVSFAVKGWLPSGIRVESIVLDPRKSRGLGETVKPYKGVKYLAVSKGGVEIRC